MITLMKNKIFSKKLCSFARENFEKNNFALLASLREKFEKNNFALLAPLREKNCA